MASKEKKQPESRDDSFTSEILHRFKAHPFLFSGTVLVLLVVIVVFIFVPAMVPEAQAGGIPVFGYYNKIPIRYVPDNYFFNTLRTLSQQYGQIPADDPMYLSAMQEMWMLAFREAVVNAGILDEMKTAGYIAPENVVDRAVAEHPALQENGRFSASRYRALDSNSRMNLWRQEQDRVTTDFYRADMMNIRLSSKEAAFVGSMAARRRTFDAAVFPVSSYPDSELLSFAAANPAYFRVTHLSRITVESGEREARQLLDSVKSGVSTFEAAAQANSKDQYAEKGGDMGIKMAYELESEIGDEQSREAIINLPGGSVSDLVQVSSGWAFFRVEEEVRPADTNDPSNLESIRNYILDRNYGRVEEWLLAEAEKFAGEVREKGFNQAVIDGNITKRNFGPIPLNYGNTGLLGSLPTSTVPELTAAATNVSFWKAAFSTPLNTLSAPVVAGDAVIVLFPLEETTLDETETDSIESYYPFWRNDNTRLVYRSYFLSSENEKLDNRFNEAFWNLWLPN